MKFRSDRTRVAVVGCAYRMPGVAGDGLWEALIAGSDLITSVEAARWSQEPFLNPRKNEPGTSYTFAAGSIGDVAGFDAAFFGISPREAEQMDPQQRVLLEMSWEAFEQAAIRPSSFRGSRCGVYVGLSSVDYSYRRADDLGAIDATTMTGNTASIAANRISYVFDLRGPSMSIDTACSSSLVALHQACQSIRHGESDAALVGGISLHLHPYGFIGFSKASMLSRQGRCRVFDERGDGYVRSEGGAVLLLKPLPQAIADGNRVMAVIVETGVNNDGRKNGLTVPSHEAQAELLRDVYERAGIAPAEIDYLEAHGTGTAVGDPIEARALGEALGSRRLPHGPLPIGSVKSNLGHLEAASGMAGLLKALGVLRHRCVPANIHLEKPNPNIDFAGWNLAPVTAPLTLAADRRLVVGVSAFGFGGTNAHAVLTSFEAAPARPRAAGVPVRAPLMLSARSPAALEEAARRMSRFLTERADLSEYDIAYSAMFTREILPYRLSARAGDRAGLAQALDRFAEKSAAAGVLTGRLRREASAPAFVFSGNGSQWVGMGLQLLDEEPLFRETIEEIDSLHATLSSHSILAALQAPPTEARLELTEVAQPALFAVQAALTRLFAQRGIRPLAVCGHSVGEVAAAWASGALTLEAAVRVIHERSAQQAKTRGRGRMAAVDLGEAETSALFRSLGLSDDIVIAAINTAGSVTVAGSDRAVTQLAGELARRRITCKRLALDYAFHSAAMDPIGANLLRALSDLPTQDSTIPLYSTVTGSVIDGSAVDAEYWWRNVREPVRFHAAIQAMMRAGINTFVEIGPRPVLTSYLNEIVRGADPEALVLPALTSTDCGIQRISAVDEQLELSGALHDPARLFPVPPTLLIELPHYAWQHERHWHTSSAESLGILARHSVHPLLGYALAEPLHWESHFDTTKLPAYADHAVGGSVVFPAAGFAEMALAAAASYRPGQHTAIEDLEILAPLVLEKEHCKVVRLRVDASDGTFAIVSREHAQADGWRTHVVGRLVGGFVPAVPPACQLPAGAPDVTRAEHYELAETLGLQYGPAFQSVSSAWFAEGALIGAIELPACVALEAQAAFLHPAYLDGALQLLLDLAHEAHSHSRDGEIPTFLPVRIDRLELVQPHAPVRSARVMLDASRPRSARALLADFTLCDDSGAAVALARGVRFRATSLPRAPRAPARWIVTHAVPMPRCDRHQALPLPSTDAAARLCAERLHSPERAASRLRFAQEVEPLLDALCAAFAERSLRELSSEDVLDIGQLITSGRVSPDGSKLLRGLVRMLAEDDILREVGERWQWATPEGAQWHYPEPGDIWVSLIRDYPEYATTIARVGTAGLRLGERLQALAAAEPRERHLSESTFSWADECTRSEGAAVSAAVRDVIAAAAAPQPSSGRPRVLYVVNALPREELGAASLGLPDREHCELTIAAPTSETLEELQARFPSAARFAGCVIDLDRELNDDSARFDFVVVASGLADASDPALRLRNLRRLLFDAGRLVLLDQYPSRAADLLYGLNPGWWRSRRGNALLEPCRRAPLAWGAILREAGFADVETVCDAPESTTGPYLLIARAAARASSGCAPLPARTGRSWLLVQDEAGSSAELAAALRGEMAQHGERVIIVTHAGDYASSGQERFALDVTSVEHWARLLAELHCAGKPVDAWLHLAGLDLRSGAAPLETRLAAQESRAAVLMAWLQACARSTLHPECWIVGSGAGASLLPAKILGCESAPQAFEPDRLRDAALWGLTRVAMQEFPEMHLRWLDLVEPLPAAASAVRMVSEILNPDAEDEILLTASGRYVPRLEAISSLPLAAAAEAAREAPPLVRLDFSAPGSSRNLLWRALTPGEQAGTPLQPDELEIEVRAAGLNFRDVMYSMGLLPEEALEAGFCGPTLGMELAGVVLRVGSEVEFAPGDEVIAIAPASFANRVRTRGFAVVRKPAAWSFAAAATVPTAFFTAYYALTELAHLRAGERVLVHGAAGAVGIAAIQIAKLVGAEVFATAGSHEKRDFVRLLGAERVFDSRSLAFADEVLQATSGIGVDVVLNSLSGEAMQRNLRLLRPFGRMIELGKRDFYENSRLGLRPFRNNIAYFGVDADQLMAQRPDAAQRVLRELMRRFADGSLRPLPHRSFCATDIEAAFRHMQASRHIGKVVVVFPPDFAPIEHPVSVPLTLHGDATYLVTGGLSGFGLQSARWLVRHGARNLVLISRRGAVTQEAQQALERFAADGVTLRAVACDVADGAAVQSVLAALKSQMPPLKGVVHAAMVIEDALIRDMDRGQLHRVLAPKIAGGWRLHEGTLDCDLDFFLLYSSATTLFGNPGQAAYVAANTAIESLAAERRERGLPVTCIKLGPIGDTGYLARHDKVRDALIGRMGGRALTAEEALQAIESSLARKAPAVGLVDFDFGVLGRFLPAAGAPKFSSLALDDSRRGRASELTHDPQQLATLPPEELLPTLRDLIRGEIAQILRLPPEQIDATTSLFDIGMDSLMAVELSLSLETRIGAKLSALALSDAPTIERIAARIAQQLQPGDEPGADAGNGATGGDSLVEQVRLVAERHASEVSDEETREVTEELSASSAPMPLTCGRHS